MRENRCFRCNTFCYVIYEPVSIWEYQYIGLEAPQPIRTYCSNCFFKLSGQNYSNISNLKLQVETNCNFCSKEKSKTISESFFAISFHDNKLHKYYYLTLCKSCFNKYYIKDL